MSKKPGDQPVTNTQPPLQSVYVTRCGLMSTRVESSDILSFWDYTAHRRVTPSLRLMPAIFG